MTLENEITLDPLARGYSSMTDQELVEDINNLYRVENVSAISSADVYDAIDPVEYPSDIIQKEQLSNIFSLSEVRVQGNTRNVLLSIFGMGTNTRTNLQSLISKNISRARELGLGIVKFQQVWEVRK